MFKKSFVLVLAALLAVSGAAPVSAGTVGYVTTRPLTAVDKTAKENLFRVQGSSDTFILLDHDAEGFFVTTSKFYGTHNYDSDLDGKYDIEKDNNVAYWLNNEFLKEGNKSEDGVDTVSYALPECIISHLVERDWLCEAGHPSSDFTEDYTVRAKIALMSVTEWKTYHSKIGLMDDTSSNYYWLRSVCGQDVSSPAQVVSIKQGITCIGKMQNAYGIRPVFYLDNDFFLDEKVDITSLGSSAAYIIRGSYSREQLQKAYSADEIDRLYRELPPQAQSVRFDGLMQVGRKLTASYTYYNADGVKEGDTEIRWLRSKELNGLYGVILGATGSEYVLTEKDAGYHIKCEVIPKSVNKVGYSVQSAASIATVAAAHSPYATDVYVDGKAVVGERLIARYFYFDSDDDIEEGTVIKWQVSSDGENYDDIPGATGVNYIVEPECAGKYIRITVQVRNDGYDGIGATVVSEKTNLVYEYPEADKPEISMNNDAVSLVGEVSNEDIICWEVITSGDEFVLAQIGSNTYKPNGSEKAVRVSVIPVSGGYIGKRVYSDELALSSSEQTAQAVNSVNVSGNRKLIIKPAKADMAYSMDIKLALNGVKINSFASDNYQVVENISENEARFILTKKAFDGAALADKVIELDVSGNGTIEITSASGINKTESGEYVSSELTLSIE